MLEAALDKGVMILQQLSARIDRSFKLADTVIDSLATAAEKALGPVTDEPAAKALAAPARLPAPAEQRSTTRPGGAGTAATAGER